VCARSKRFTSLAAIHRKYAQVLGFPATCYSFERGASFEPVWKHCWRVKVVCQSDIGRNRHKTSKWTVPHCSGASELYPHVRLWLNRRTFRVTNTVQFGPLKTLKRPFLKYFRVLNFSYRRGKNSKMKQRLMNTFIICVSDWKTLA